MAQVGFVFVGALVLALKYGACKFLCMILHGGGWIEALQGTFLDEK